MTAHRHLSLDRSSYVNVTGFILLIYSGVPCGTPVKSSIRRPFVVNIVLASGVHLFHAR